MTKGTFNISHLLTAPTICWCLSTIYPFLFALEVQSLFHFYENTLKDPTGGQRSWALAGLKSVYPSITNSSKWNSSWPTAAVIPVQAGDLTVWGTCNFSKLAHLSDGGGKAGGWGGGAAAGTSHEVKLDGRTDGQTDRCVIVGAPQTAVGHHCRALGLIEGWWENITSKGGGDTAAAGANY